MNVEDLSTEQRYVFNSVVEWLLDKNSKQQLLTLGGYAGTGKSTVVGVIATVLSKMGLHCAFAAYTGKASNVLRDKLAASGVVGANVGTIHRLMYNPVTDPVTGEINGWAKKETLGRISLIIVDEASMVPSAMLDDLLSYEVRVLAVGDHGQLPPVKETGSLMMRPHLRLETIHRQAAGNPIIRLSERVRNSGRFLGSDFDGKRALLRPRGKIYEDIESRFTEDHGKSATGAWEVASRTGIITYTNSVRTRLNNHARRALGRFEPMELGDVVMCLRNVRTQPGEPSIYNGMRAVVNGIKQDGRNHLGLDLHFPDEGIRVHHRACRHQFGQERTFASLTDTHRFGFEPSNWGQMGLLYDFGYVLTAHKAQGSQFEEVLVLADRPMRASDDDWRRWAYTAVTRASHRLVVYE